MFSKGIGSGLNTVRLAVRAELVEAHSPFDRLRANVLNRTVLGQVFHYPMLFDPLRKPLPTGSPGTNGGNPRKAHSVGRQ